MATSLLTGKPAPSPLFNTGPSDGFSCHVKPSKLIAAHKGTERERERRGEESRGGKGRGEERRGYERCTPYMKNAFLHQAGLMYHPLNTQEITSGWRPPFTDMIN